MRLPLVDTLKSLVTGLGTAKDKTVEMAYAHRIVSEAELNAMHRSDWLARKIVDIIPNDMTREWRDWQAGDDQIEAIEKLERAPLVNLQPKVNEAMRKARLFGGSAIYIGMKNEDPTQPLDLERIGKDSLEYLHVLHRHEITAGPITRDVTSELYGEPEYYQVQGANGMSAKVHPTRVIRFIGAEVLDTRQQDTEGWGDSILQVVYDAIQNASSAQQHVAALIPEAKTDVIYIPGLSGFLRDAGTTRQLTDRFTYANTIKSMFNMVLLEGNGGAGGTDQGEKWEQKQISFAQLPELMRQFLQVASGAADIPVTRLLGESPAGLNATGKSDLQNYYDNIAARQRTELAPALNRLDEIIIRSATGKRDPAIYYEWAPLWGMSEKEKADIFKLKADAARAIAGTGTSPPLMPIEALSDALVNALVEDGSLPGLEAAIDEYGKLSEQKEDDEDLQASVTPNVAPKRAANDKKLDASAMEVGDLVEFLSDLQAEKGPSAGSVIAVGKGTVTIKHSDHEGEVFKTADLKVTKLTTAAKGGRLWQLDAAPRTLYVRRDVLNADEIIAWAKGQGFETTLPAADLHVTIAFSREPLDWMKVGEAWSFGDGKGKLTVNPGGPRLMERFGDAVVLLFSSSDLQWRHMAIREAGASWDHPEYQPHITITYKPGAVDIEKVEPYRGRIVLGPEIFEEVKEDWQSNIDEE